MCRPRLLKTGWAPGVEEACSAQSPGVAASLPLRAATDGGRGVLQRLGFLPLKWIWLGGHTNK